MKVQNKNTPSFGSIPIYKAKLVQPLVLRPFVPRLQVFVSELERSDVPRLSAAYDYWGKTSLGGRIIGSFEKRFLDYCDIYDRNKRFFVVETMEKNPKARGIKALAHVKIEDDHIFLDLLQSQKERLKMFSQKGAGSSILYLLSRLTKAKRKGAFALHSTKKAMGFYQKQKGLIHYILPRYGYNVDCFQMPRNAMDAFEQEVAKKYSITPMIDDISYFS